MLKELIIIVLVIAAGCGLASLIGGFVMTNIHGVPMDEHVCPLCGSDYGANGFCSGGCPVLGD